MPKDLRYFLERLQERAPEEFVSVGRSVEPEYELPAVVRKLQAERRYPAVLLDKVVLSRFAARPGWSNTYRLVARKWGSA